MTANRSHWRGHCGRGHVRRAGAVWLTVEVSGTGIGSLNWLLRTLTGALFGLASVWLAYPLLETGLADIRRQVATRLSRAGVIGRQVRRR